MVRKPSAPTAIKLNPVTLNVRCIGFGASVTLVSTVEVVVSDSDLVVEK